MFLGLPSLFDSMVTLGDTSFMLPRLYHSDDFQATASIYKNLFHLFPIQKKLFHCLLAPGFLSFFRHLVLFEVF